MNVIEFCSVIFFTSPFLPSIGDLSIDTGFPVVPALLVTLVIYLRAFLVPTLSITELFSPRPRHRHTFSKLRLQVMAKTKGLVRQFMGRLSTYG